MNIQTMVCTENIVRTGCLLVAMVLAAVVYKSIRRSKLFSDWVVFTLSFLIAFLCLIGMYQLFLCSEVGVDFPNQSQSPGTTVMTFSYRNFACFLALMSVVMIIAKIAFLGQPGEPQENFNTPSGEPTSSETLCAESSTTRNLPDRLNTRCSTPSDVRADPLNRTHEQVSVPDHKTPSSPKPSSSEGTEHEE